jgi:hypothetical protein
MTTVIGANREEFILREMARRAGKKYEPANNQEVNPYQNMTAEELKAHTDMINAVIKNAEDN